MSLDDLLPLLLIAAFVISALARNKKRGKPGSGTPQGRPGAPATGEAPERSAGGPVRADTSGQGQGQDPQDTLRQRLEQARRRVQEAIEQELDGEGKATRGRSPSASSSSPTLAPSSTQRRTIGSTGSAPTTVSGRPIGPAPSVAPSASGSGADASRSASTASAERAGARATADQQARQARRSASDKQQARQQQSSGSQPFGSLRANDLARGVIWREVLGPPLSQRRRRTPSPRRSP